MPGGAAALSALVAPQSRSHSTHAAFPAEGERGGAGCGKDRVKGDWLTLPPFDHAVVDGAALGRELLRGGSAKPGEAATMTALKWVLRCCPELLQSLVQKLFRLRQVRREFSEGGLSDVSTQKVDSHLKRDDAIIAVNKPPGMPVQASVEAWMRWPSPVRSMITKKTLDWCTDLTKIAVASLHSLFREKTVGALKNDSASRKRLLQRKYWALVIGSPRRSKGVISAPLGKVLMDNGKSDRITIVSGCQTIPSHHAITEYEVIGSRHGE